MEGWSSIWYLPPEVAAALPSGQFTTWTAPLVKPWFPVTLNTGSERPGTAQKLGPNTPLTSVPVCWRSNSPWPPPG